jgi:hypothetical protein
MSFPRPWQGAAFLCAVVLVASGCGSDSKEQKPPPVPELASPADFPSAKGKTLDQIRGGLESGPELKPSVLILVPGKNRYGFGLFDQAQKQVGASPAVVYYAPKAGGTARGPYPARWESMEVKPAFQSENVANDPDTAKGLYVATVPFKESDHYEMIAVVKLDDRLVATEPVPTDVFSKTPVPKVGQKAIKVSTPTRGDVPDISSIETRMPPDTMHEADFADVLGKKPVVLLFSTPALCQSRVCGPVTDVTEQVKADTKGVTFIHMEIYKDNDVDKGYRPQVRKWGLPTEPWAFVIDKKGKIVARFEGAFSPRELAEALRLVTSG